MLCPMLLTESVAAEVKAYLRGVSPRFHARKREETMAESHSRLRQQSKGTAVLSLYGMLELRQSMLGVVFGGTGLLAFGRMLDMAVNDPGIGQIVIEIDSGGGEVSGVPELGEKIYAARKVKPIIGHINSIAGSGAFWLASQCSQLICTPSGMAGSIGCYILHVDEREALNKEGIAVEFIRVPEEKASGNPYEALSDAARANYLKQAQSIHSDFVGAVARGRGVSRGHVMDRMGRGLMLQAGEAKVAKMVDAIVPFDQTIQAVLSGSKPGSKVSTDIMRMRLELAESRAGCN